MSNSDFTGLTDSDWNRLPENQRAEFLRKQAAELVRRHREVIHGQKVLGSRIDAHGALIHAGAESVQDIKARVDVLAGDLSVNTTLTQQVKSDTATIVETFHTLENALKAFDLITRFTAKVAIPVGVLYGVYQAVMGWVNGTWFR